MKYEKLDHEATFEDLKKFSYPNQKIGIIAHIENEKGEILLQQRGSKARDEHGLWEDIGGKVEKEDIDLKAALLREMKEEAGEKVILTVEDSIGIYHCPKKETNWIFVIYFVRYVEGPFEIMEPEKCSGYKFFPYEEAIHSDVVTESCKFLLKAIKNQRYNG